MTLTEIAFVSVFCAFWLASFLAVKRGRTITRTPSPLFLEDAPLDLVPHAQTAHTHHVREITHVTPEHDAGIHLHH